MFSYRKIFLTSIFVFLGLSSAVFVLATGGTFLQTNWNGGQTTNTATHSFNQTSWDQYSAKDANLTLINSGADLTLTNSTGTTNVDFNTESQYTQQDATNGTDFSGTQVTLHSTGISATGGTITYTDSSGLNPRTSPAYSGGYTVHTFTSSGTFTPNGSGNVTALVVAGGGGGGSSHSGGGGAGGLLYNTSVSVTAGSYTVTVGGGGAAATNGENSVFSTLTAVGGGAGAVYTGLTPAGPAGQDGGSGGGGGPLSITTSGGAGTSGQGHNGGSGYAVDPSYTGGGGGGAAAAGSAGSGSAGGSGGAGSSYSISGTATYYAGGGGGTAYKKQGSTYYYIPGGSGGVGGGGNGPCITPGYMTTGTNGTANTGGGGGGNGYSGGSGIVIIRYPSGSNYPTTSYYVTTATGSQKDTSAWGSISSVTMTQTTPTNTDIKYLVSFDGRTTWKYWNGSAWTASTLGNISTDGMTKSTIEAITQSQWSASGGFAPGTLDFAANLSTTDSGVTPSLDNIAINYNLQQTQTLTSSVYNTELSIGNPYKIQWTENLSSNTDIKFQLRTSPDGSNWGPWCGPDDGTAGTCTSTTYFTSPTGTEVVDDIQRDRSNDQYFQYKAFLVSTDGINAPTLSDVSVFYFLAATPVYFSVGQSTSDLKTGTPNVSITSGVATFDVAQTGNIGVGDVVVVNSISYYIASKTSTTVWNVVTATGTIPADISSTAVTSIKHVYTSLNSAVAGASTLIGSSDLTAVNIALNIPCYYDSAADTTAVTVSGYTTDATRYIRIYTPYNTTTESNNSQRHSGKWDTTKYRLETTGGAISSYVNYYSIDGLQIKSTRAISGQIDVIGHSIISGYAITNISNNIIVGNFSGGATGYGIRVVSSAETLKAYNNIFYNFSPSGSRGIHNSYRTAYINNNTFVNCDTGIYNDGNTIAKNNLFKSNTTPAAGTFNAGTDYNATDSASMGYTVTGGGNAHDKLSQAFSFIDATNSDFHLSPTDTAAQNAGADLSADTNLSFTTDIDGQTRNQNALGWDIGADEGATQIFYSVGQNTTDHKTGTPLVTVSGTTATFDTAQTATNMGVGDLVTYTGGTCYLSGKTSTTVWSCVSATGSAPTAATNASVTSIIHAFSSLEGAVDANNANGAHDSSHLNTTDLFTNNYQLNIPCYYDTGADTAAVTVRSWTTRVQNYVKIYTPNNATSEVNQTQRHSGKLNSTKYKLSVGSVKALTINNNYTEIDGLQLVASTSNGNAYGADAEALNIKLHNLMVWAYHGINVGSSGRAFIYDSILYGGGGRGIYLATYNQCFAYNNTVYNFATGFSRAFSTSHILKNNIAYNNTTDYDSPYSASSTNNLSKDATSPNSGATDCGGHSCRSQTVNFISTTSGSEDFHLSPTDTAAKNSGADLSADTYLPFTTDIDGETRASGRWDIGADENNSINVQINRNVQFNHNVQIK